MMIAVSTDNGATFSAPKLIALDKWKLSVCPHSSATLAVHHRIPPNNGLSIDGETIENTLANHARLPK
jgi:hypothetical protein